MLGLRRLFMHTGTRAPCPYFEIPIRLIRDRRYFLTNVSLLPNFTIREEQFFFPEPGNEMEVACLQDVRFCIWCVHMIKTWGGK